MSDVTYSEIKPYATNKQPMTARVFMVEQSATLYPESSAESASLTAIEDDRWNLLANVNSFTITPETEDDEVQYFDPNTLSWVKDPQTSISRRNITFNVVNYPALFDAIIKGVPNPTSAEGLAGISAGSADGAQLFASNDPAVKVAMKVEIYAKSNTKLQTLWFYAKIMATEAVEFNGKTPQPTLTAEVQQSVWNRLKNEAAFTQQTVQA